MSSSKTEMVTQLSDNENLEYIQKEIDQLESNMVRVAILIIIRDADENDPIYGYRLSEKINELTYGAIAATNATLYSKLRVLKEKGYVEQYEEMGDPRKYYRLTELGKLGCIKLITKWEAYSNYIKILNEYKK